MTNEITKKEILSVQISETDLKPLVERCLSAVRDEVKDSSYIQEALRVLTVKGYRSAIGCFWNAVVDDLRNKIIYRSLALFNKSMNVGKTINSYEDFQSHVNDDQLIEGSYKIGVIGYEASKILKHAKETRHFFDGHPKSSEPSIIKVLAMMDDCVKYVLNAPYPAKIVDIDEYVTTMNGVNFDRNEVAIETALTELPEIYKNELANRLFTDYTQSEASSVLRSNVEFVIPILWRVLAKEVQIQLIRRVDHIVAKGNIPETEQAFSFAYKVNAVSYLSPAAKKYKIAPLVKELKNKLDDWTSENKIIKELLPFASVIPADLVIDYVWSITHTYIGTTGSSMYCKRTNFYADEAAIYIPIMFQLFDDNAAEAFINCIRKSPILQGRIENPSKIGRLRSLGNIVLGRISSNVKDRTLLELLVNEGKEAEFKNMYRKAS